jgi:phosphomannomutase
VPQKIIFSTTGIRGKANVDLTPEYCIVVGRAIAKWLKTSNIERPKVLIGRDSRRSSWMLMNAISSGLLASGVDVFYVEQSVPTPLIIHELSIYKLNAAIIVTGSHLPASDNGIILINEDGSYFRGELEFSVLNEEWQNIGKFLQLHHNERSYLDRLNHYAKNLPLIEKKVLLDAVHGPMKLFLRHILESKVKNLVLLNYEDDDTISGRNSEPNEENLIKTVEYFKLQNCDLGITTDFDGDRLIFISKSGKVISGDIMGTIIAIDTWKKFPDKPVVVPINTSSILSDIATKLNKKVIFTKIGAPAIIDTMKEHEAYFGFEETGKYFFNPDCFYPDAAFSAIYVLNIIKEYNYDLDSMVSTFPLYYSIKHKFPSLRKQMDEKYFALVDSLSELQGNLPSEMRIVHTDNLDGIRLNFEDNSWVLIRQSGTEDNMRIFSESKVKEKAHLINKIVTNHVKTILVKFDN